MTFYTYIMTCWSKTAIYIGATSDLRASVCGHRLGIKSKHTAKYKIIKLVYYEAHPTLASAIARQQKLTKWRRAWKNALIVEDNPGWADLSWKLFHAEVPDQVRDMGATGFAGE
jgi:putative endonuclease